MQKEQITKNIERVEIENANAELMIGFYLYLADQEKSKEKSAQYKVKADQLKANVEFNNKFLNYARTL